MDINLENVVFTYMKGTPFEKKALDNINILFPKGSITGIVGNTGSGKSTILQLIAGLLIPDNGKVTIGEMCWSSMKDNYDLRKMIGIAFQNPENQLFEDTIEKDISYGPNNFGISEKQTLDYIKDIMKRINLPYEKYAKMSPFELSEGQKRKVAIAGILAYKPKILLLDEPFAGMDLVGKNEILRMIKDLHALKDAITIIVSHNMDEIASIVDNIIVLNNGKVVIEGEPEKIFADINLLEENNLDIPEITRLIKKINEKIYPQIPLNCFSIEKLEEYIIERIQGG